MAPGGDSGAKVNLIRECDCSGSALRTDLGFISKSFWTPESIHSGSDFMIHFVMCFLLLLERFGIDFGAFLVSKEYPKLEISKCRSRCFTLVKTMFLRFEG